MKNVEALQALYAALGGEPADVANATTSVEVLNAIAAMFEGEDDAVLNPEAIENIAAVADNIGGGGAAKYAFKSLNVPSSVTGTSQIEYTNVYNPVKSDEYEIQFAQNHADDFIGNLAYAAQPLGKAEILFSVPSGTIYFTPSADFDGFYNTQTETKLSLSGDNISPGDGFIYQASCSAMTSTVTITKTAIGAKVTNF